MNGKDSEIRTDPMYDFGPHVSMDGSDSATHISCSEYGDKVYLQHPLRRQMNKLAGCNHKDNQGLRLMVYAMIIICLFIVAQTIGFAVSYSRRDVSFLAADRRQEQTIEGHGVVQFPTLRHHSDTPQGYGFDNTTGKFRCPFNGTYVFTFHTTTGECNKEFTFLIRRGSIILAGTRASTNSGVCHLPMGVSAVTYCRQGEFVYVKNSWPWSRVIDSSPNDLITNFAGFLINS